MTKADNSHAGVSTIGVTKAFGSNEVLHGIDFSIGEGEVVALIGPSGAGKSTMLRGLTLLDTFDGGELRYGDLVVCQDGAYDQSALQAARMCFGIVFQNYNLFPHYTVMQNVCDAPIVVQGRDKAEVEEEARKLLAHLGLSDHATKVPCELSGGQQQRVAIARALAMKPKVMYFDEATSALDPKLTADMHRLIRELASDGMSIGIVTHEMGFARASADRVCFLIDGLLVEEGPAAKVIDHPSDPRTQDFLAHAAD